MKSLSCSTSPGLCGRLCHPHRMAGRTNPEENQLMTEPRSGPKPRPVRITDELYDQLTIVASLDGTSVTAAITKAIEAYVEQRRGEGDLAARATQALEEIEREAAARRAAIESLIADPRTGVHPPATAPGGGETPTPTTDPETPSETAKRRRPAGFTSTWL